MADATGTGLSNWQKFGMGTSAGSMLGGGLFNMFGDHNNPADAAKPYYDQIPGAVKPYYDPYVQAGQGQIPKLSEQFNQLMQNPSEMMNRFGQGYQQSPGYQFQMDQSQRAIQNAMASGGMTGTPQHELGAGQAAGQLANQDYYNYLNHVMSMYGQGLSGGQDMMHQGYNASSSLADILGSNLAQQGNMAYQGQAGENSADSQGMSNIFGGLGAFASLASLL